MQLKQPNPVRIETQRMNLVGYSVEEISFIFEKFEKSDIMKVLGHRNEADYQSELFKHQNGYATYNRSFLMFLLCDKPTQQVIGRCGLHNWNKEHKRAEIGYSMSDECFKQKGLMSEAVAAIIQYGFHTLQLNRIEALVGSENVASLKIIEGQNFIKEGVLRDHYALGDGYEDSIAFSLLRKEYLSEK